MRRRRGGQWPWLLSDAGAGTAAVLVAAAGIGAAVAMYRLAGGAPDTEQVKLRIESIRYGIGTVAAAGAVVALLLAFRKQRHTEQAQAHTEVDAAERRVTDLYTKAVEQLGHEQAAVRLGGLYALERLAQITPDQRQTIVNVICAYLRMPYSPPPDDDRASSATPAPGAGRDAHQELQVRRTAQRILTNHLTLPMDPATSQTLWPDIDLDLSGATLVDWDLSEGRVREGDFADATFIGPASFDSTHFAESTGFRGARFTDHAYFGGARFVGTANFDGAAFAGDVAFEHVRFDDQAWYKATRFTAEASFDDTRYDGEVFFNNASFDGPARFRRTAFTGDSSFTGVTFTRDAAFTSARFARSAWFSGCAFGGAAGFDDASFERAAGFSDVSFTGQVSFRRGTYAGDVIFDNAWVKEGAAQPTSWPLRWRTMLDGARPGWLRLVRADDLATVRPEPVPGSGPLGNGKLAEQ